MACNPEQLVNNAKCIACGIPPGMAWSVLIYLACTKLNNQKPCVNLIPQGSTYIGINHHFNIGTFLTINTNYQVIFGANDAELTNNNGSPGDLLAPGTFAFTTGNLLNVVLFGTANIPVTAIVCAV